MDTYEIVQYSTPKGGSPFAQWMVGLSGGVAAKVYTAVRRMEVGNFSDSRLLTGVIRERRIHAGPGYRIYYAVHQRRYVVLLGGGTKRTQTADIRRARKSWYEFKTRGN